MKNGTCPECGSTEVYRGASAEGEGLTAGTYNSLIEINAGKTQVILWVDTLICSVCGYLEMRVANNKDLPWLMRADGWEKIAPSLSGMDERETHDSARDSSS